MQSQLYKWKLSRSVYRLWGSRNPIDHAVVLRCLGVTCFRDSSLLACRGHCRGVCEKDWVTIVGYMGMAVRRNVTLESVSVAPGNAVMYVAQSNTIP